MDNHVEDFRHEDRDDDDDDNHILANSHNVSETQAKRKRRARDNDNEDKQRNKGNRRHTNNKHETQTEEHTCVLAASRLIDGSLYCLSKLPAKGVQLVKDPTAIQDTYVLPMLYETATRERATHEHT